MARPLAVALAALLAVAACGTDDPKLDAACTESPAAIARALERAPAPVTLSKGTRLSECVSRARSDAELQNTGAVLTRVADDLAERARHGELHAAVALGYLVGAARRGAAKTSGIHAELQRRVERAAAYLDEGGAAMSVALRQGIRAGRATG